MDDKNVMNEIKEKINAEKKFEVKGKEIFGFIVTKWINPLVEHIIENVNLENKESIQTKIGKFLKKIKLAVEKSEGDFKRIYGTIKKLPDSGKKIREESDVDKIRDELRDLDKLIGELENMIISILKAPNESLINIISEEIKSIKMLFESVIEDIKNLDQGIKKEIAA